MDRSFHYPVRWFPDAEINSEGFPLEGMPQNIREFVLSIMHDTNAPIGAIASAMLGAMGIAAQHNYCVRKRKGLESPLAVWMLILQESGERKTSVLNAVLEGIRQYVFERDRQCKKTKREVDIAHRLWKMKLSTLEREAEKATDDPVYAAKLMDQLKKHVHAEPAMPVLTRPFLEDATYEALVTSISEAGGSATSIVTDELTRMFRGRVMMNPGFLCKAFDESPAQIDRIRSGQTTIDKPLVSFLLMGQNKIFEDVLKRSGKELISSGFMARFCIAAVAPTAGTRFLTEQSNPFPLARRWFSERCKELLEDADRGVHSTTNGKKVLILSLEAQYCWNEYHDNVEVRMRRGYEFFNIKEFASRCSDKAARIAALLHIFGADKSEQISVDEILCAISIMKWYTAQYIGVAGEYSLPTVEQDAIALRRFLHEKYQSGYGVFFGLTYLRQYGPYRLRDKRRLYGAIEFLSSSSEVLHCHIRRSAYIQLNLNSFGNIPQFGAPVSTW